MVNIKICPFEDLTERNQKEIATYIAEYTNGNLDEVPQMLPVTSDDVYAKHLGFVTLATTESAEDTFAGYVGASCPQEWQGQQMCEVGTLWVPQNFRKQGIAHGLVSAISQALVVQQKLPFAFCNPKSKPVFMQVGYVEAEVADLPPSAFGECAKCPVRPTNGCCDELFIYGGDQ